MAAVIRDLSTLRRVRFKPIAKEKSADNVVRRMLIEGNNVTPREDYIRSTLLQYTVVPAPSASKVIYSVKEGYYQNSGELAYPYVTLASVFTEWARIIGVSNIWNRYFHKDQKDEVIAWLPSNLRYEWTESRGILRCRINRPVNETTFSFTDEVLPDTSIFTHKDDFFDILFDIVKLDLAAMRTNTSRETPISVSVFDYIEEIPS